MPTSRDRTTLAIFLVVSALAGGNGVGVRFSNRELDPMWGATLRFALASVVLMVIARLRHQAIPRGRPLAAAALYGLLSFGGAFSLTYYGLVEVQAGLGQTILALVPLATLLLAVLQRQERMTGAAVMGTLLAVSGIAVISGIGTTGTAPILSILALVGSALCFAEAAVLVHRLPPISPVVLNAVGMAAGAAMLMLISLVAGESIRLPALAATWTAIAYLVIAGSVVVFILYVILLQRWQASRAAYTFVVIPVFAILFSAWLDNEQIGLELVGGGLLVVAGVYVGALRPRS